MTSSAHWMELRSKVDLSSAQNILVKYFLVATICRYVSTYIFSNFNSKTSQHWLVALWIWSNPILTSSSSSRYSSSSTILVQTSRRTSLEPSWSGYNHTCCNAKVRLVFVSKSFCFQIRVVFKYVWFKISGVVLVLETLYLNIVILCQFMCRHVGPLILERLFIQADK